MFGQHHSWDGWVTKPNGKYHYLNIFVNVIYDVHPEYNDQFSNPTFWPPVTDPSLEGINTAAIPIYLLDFMDTVYLPGQLHGTCTRLYGESSFDSLQITGDFVVVNIRESTVLSQGTFDYSLIESIAINMLQQSSAFTLYGHRNFDDFKVRNVLFRNITQSYGNLNPGSGYGLFNTTQCVGDGDFYANPTSIIIHEISHSLFGSNAFHTSGGNHRYVDGTVMAFLNLQCGYGLMGAAGSGLVSCNGYERWRMHWKHPQAVDYISARDITNTQSISSDISKESGNRNFILRDFVTYGDVIRIKLPYKDSVTSSNQYIWLENHQVGNNNKLDFLQYSNYDQYVYCRPQGIAGIYAYYQIGRDILEGEYNQVWDSQHRDNLKIIPAEGYYDYEQLSETHNVNCVSYTDHDYSVRRGVENSLCGGQDQEFPLFPKATDTVLYISQEFEIWRKYIDTVKDDHLPQLGDTLDAFRTHIKINMGTNPSTNNAKTYHSTNYNPGTVISSRLPEKNTQTTYLTGLSIEMTPIQGTGNFLVSIRWDDYDITNDTRWTGKIALKETAILTTGNTITLAQNRTVAQPTRDPETGLFAGRTNWRCEDGSFFRQDSGSVVRLTENSSLVFEPGSRYELSKSARLEVKAGCAVTVQQGAIVCLKGIVEVDSGGVFNLYDTAKMGDLSRIIVRPGGKLVVDGGTITSACSGEMWQGIEVVGNPDKRQIPQWQGVVELKNGATIENAHCAIRTGLQGDSVYVTTGGIIQADSAFFINNRRSVEFMSYTNHSPAGNVINNQSYFYRCAFTVNDDNLFALNNAPFIDHVTMWAVRGVKFRGCDFRNLTTTSGDRRHAIYTDDAGFSVDDYCSANIYVGCECPGYSKSSTFSGFTTAVEVNTSGHQHSVNVNHAQFTNNGTGVRVNGNNYVTVTRNTFNLDNSPSPSSGNIGLYLNNCTGYLVEDNTFERSTYPSGLFFIDNSTGICVAGSGISPNSIHYNHFNNLTKGISVVGTNGHHKWSGLQMTCNDFSGGKHDIYLNNGATVSYVQGSSTKGADNMFSNVTYNTTNFHNPNAVPPISYYYSNSYSNLDPAHYSNLNKTLINTEYNCASTLCDNSSQPLLAGFQSDMNAYATALANQSPADGTDGGTVETQNFESLQTMSQTLSETYYNAVRGLMADTVLDLGELEQWHTVAQPIADPYSLTETQFMMGYSEPFVADADDAELSNYADFHAMKLALRNGNLNDNADNMDNNDSPGINWYALTPAQIAQLQTIAERNTGRASVMAKGVLCFFFGICYDDDLSVDDNADNQDNNSDAENRSAKAPQQGGETYLNVYPNPTDDVLYVELSSAGIQSVGLYDLQGRVVETHGRASLSGVATINVRSVPAGVYVLRVTDANGREYHRKVVVK
jgi:hypothetical protein